MVLSGIGMTLIGTAVVMGGYDLMKSKQPHRKLKKEMKNAFLNGELYKEHKYKGRTYKQLPKVISTTIKNHMTTVIFNIPYGLNPDLFEERQYIFRQHFGKYVELDMEDRRGILHIYPKGLPTQVNYDYEKIAPTISKMKLPIVIGQQLNQSIKVIDMVEHPHILIAGETGSGKSSAVRSILSTLIQHLDPTGLKLLLGDLKRSEFHLFKNLGHVEGVYHSADELLVPLKKIRKEMTRRGNLLDRYEVNSIGELKEKMPYIVVCIDEVVLLKKEKEIMDILEEISSIGRSLGVFLILSMQRPDSKLLDGKLKVNMTVRMGFKTADKINARIIGTDGSEELKVAGRMILRVDSELQEIQGIWLDNDKARGLLSPYKEKPKLPPQKPLEDHFKPNESHDNVVELFRKWEKEI